MVSCSSRSLSFLQAATLGLDNQEGTASACVFLQLPPTPVPSPLPQWPLVVSGTHMVLSRQTPLSSHAIASVYPPTPLPLHLLNSPCPGAHCFSSLHVPQSHLDYFLETDCATQF